MNFSSSPARANDLATTGFYFAESFTATALAQPTKWTLGGVTPPSLTAGAASTPDDKAGSGVLRLTSNAQNQSGFALYADAFDATKGLNITFDIFAYGGDGADGISFFLVDGAQSPTAAGSPGAALGYASSAFYTANPSGGITGAGLVGGYLGIGFDEFGGFSSDDAPGGPGGTIGAITRPDSVAVRGSQAQQYKFLTGTETLAGGIDGTLSATGYAQRSTVRRTVEIDITRTGLLDVAIDLNQNGVFEDAERVINDYDVVTNNGALPGTLKFGFASSTGGSTNVHEVRNLALSPSKTSNGGALNTVNEVSFGGFGTGATYVENATAVTIAQGLTIDDSTPATATTITGATVNINKKFNSTQDRLTIAGQPLTTTSGTVDGLNWAYDVATGTLTLSAPTGTTGTVAAYQSALSKVAYGNISDAPTTDDRTIRYTINNGNTLVSLRDTLVKVNAVNDAPTGVTLPTTNVPVDQAGAIVGKLTVIDPDGPGPNSFTVTGGNDLFEVDTNGNLKLKAGATVTRTTTIAPVTVTVGDGGAAPNSFPQIFNLTPKSRLPEIFWRNTANGTAAFWSIDNTSEWKNGYVVTHGPRNTAVAGQVVSGLDSGWQVKASGDFGSVAGAKDGIVDFIFQKGPNMVIWYMANDAQGQTSILDGTTSLRLSGQSVNLAGWEMAGTADMDKDGILDLVLRNAAADTTVIWKMNGTPDIVGSATVFNASGQIARTGTTNTTIAGLGDFDGDGTTDILYRGGDGSVSYWKMSGATLQQAASTTLVSAGRLPLSYEIKAVGDYNGDTFSDIVYRFQAGDHTVLQTIRAGATAQNPLFSDLPKATPGWQIEASTDMNGDGTPDLVWRDRAADQTAVWTMRSGLATPRFVTDSRPGVTPPATALAKASPAWDIDAAAPA